MYIESEFLELKEKYTDTIVRDIVAFLNAQGGELYIGVSDRGQIVGIPGNIIDEVQKKVSDCITDQIEPNPQSEIKTEILIENTKIILKLNIASGYRPLYCIKKYGFSSKGCLIRIGTTCKEMGLEEIEFRYQKNYIDDDFILQAPAHYAPLSFEMMKILLVSKGYHINQTSFESSYSLLRRDGSYNLMAELLSDKNMISMIFVKFNGKNKASIAQRSDYGDQSILLCYQRLKDRLIAENICKTDTTVRPRVDEYLYDMDCVNEVLVNAIVHNDWTISEPLVSFFDDRLEIISHGGLPRGTSREEFFNGVSHPRNTILMRVFLKLGIVEHAGHGIPTIIKKYGKDVFNINDFNINVVIPFNPRVLELINDGKNLGKNDGKNLGKNPENTELSENEKRILLELIHNPSVSYNLLVDELKISRRTISRVFASLVEKGYITRVGSNKKGYWKIMK